MMQLTRKQILLLLVFAFSFLYRLTLMLWNTYPSGADIGLHGSVINSITGSGKTNFLWNFYQMGGGLSLTFPGYHIFTAGVMMMTGLPDYISQAVVVSFFSSVVVLCAFLITKKLSTESAAFVVSFLVALSRFDIEMLLWGGYPNVITLMLIPLTFYLYLQKDRFSAVPFLVSTSILASSIFLTHSLSAAIFVGTILAALFFLLIAPKTFGASRKTGLYWLAPIILGAGLVAPFLAQAIPAYLSANATFKVSSATEAINSATLSTRILPLEIVLPLFLILPAFLLFSRRYRGRLINLPVLLLCLWLFMPLFLTQGYLFGFIIDYNRFLYFVILPIMIFIGMMIDHGSDFFAKTVDVYRSLNNQTVKAKTGVDAAAPTSRNSAHGFFARVRVSLENQRLKSKRNSVKTARWLSKHLTHKTIYGIFILTFLLFSAFVIPIFALPNQSESIASFYQFMDNPGWEGLHWIKDNTPANSVFVSDAHYGWWLSGFGERPTLSAVDPQYLTLAREFPLAKNASNLLDTDYFVDNGFVQVREDGGYIARHNPEILANLNWTYFPYSFFTFDSSQNVMKYSVGGTQFSTTLDELAVKEMRMIVYPANDSDYNTVVISRGNEFFNYTQYTTVYKGVRFVNMTAVVDTTVPGVSLDWLDIDVQSKGIPIEYTNAQTIGLIDLGVKTFGQLIFSDNQPNVTPPSINSAQIHLQYNLQSSVRSEFQIEAAAYSVTDSLTHYGDAKTMNGYFGNLMTENLNGYQNKIIDEPFKESFDYRVSLSDHAVSYVAIPQAEAEMYPKFERDPAFSLVFINSGVAIFKVKGNLNQDG